MLERFRNEIDNLNLKNNINKISTECYTIRQQAVKLIYQMLRKFLQYLLFFLTVRLSLVFKKNANIFNSFFLKTLYISFK